MIDIFSILLQPHGILLIWIVNQKREQQTVLSEILTDRCRTITKIGGSVGLFEGLSFTNFLIALENSQNLRMHIEEKSIPTYCAGPHACINVENFYFILVESC